MTRTFIYHPEWKSFIDRISDPMEKLALHELVTEYGTTGEYTLSSCEFANAYFESMIKPLIDKEQKNYQDMVEAGRAGGLAKPKLVDDDKIYQMAMFGKPGAAIAKELGLSTSALYHSEGWKRA